MRSHLNNRKKLSYYWNAAITEIQYLHVAMNNKDAVDELMLCKHTVSGLNTFTLGLMLQPLLFAITRKTKIKICSRFLLCSIMFFCSRKIPSVQDAQGI